MERRRRSRSYLGVRPLGGEGKASEGLGTTRWRMRFLVSCQLRQQRQSKRCTSLDTLVFSKQSWRGRLMGSGEEANVDQRDLSFALSLGHSDTDSRVQQARRTTAQLRGSPLCSNARRHSCPARSLRPGSLLKRRVRSGPDRPDELMHSLQAAV